MIYFKDIINLLQTQEWENESEVIEIAKGKHEMPKSCKGAVKQLKRGLKWQLRK